jgi:Fungal specific transcription factor domain
MCYLIDYYDKAICPAMMAYDGPNNPYRIHILQLAVDSEGLSNAICALSVSHMRMRKKQALVLEKYRTAFCHTPVPGQSADYEMAMDYTTFNPNGGEALAHEVLEDVLAERDPSPEETTHKSNSIMLLNAQLVDPIAAKSDSALAILFILSLYHTCETGVTKLKTHISGVKQLLTMRGTGKTPRNWGWMETLFTWFDAMSSTVNDREALMRGNYLDLIASVPAISDSKGWDLENLAGCDRNLFQTIGKLGRLNMLSQHRTVLPNEIEETPVTSPTSITSSLPLKSPRPRGPSRSMSYDGNGFRPMPQNPPNFSGLNPQLSFWTEWRATRAALQNWSFNPSFTASCTLSPYSSEQASAQPRQTDFRNTSEAFRSAALLYTERLAYPHLPSSAPSLQKLVARSIYHISAIPLACGLNKFLLWPLFIVGSECVIEQQRSLIRERCLGIQGESGFFNNIAGLGVLERVWEAENTAAAREAATQLQGLGNADVEVNWSNLDSHQRREEDRPARTRDTGRDAVVGGQGFKWRKIIEDVDGEYIMI